MSSTVVKSSSAPYGRIVEIRPAEDEHTPAVVALLRAADDSRVLSEESLRLTRLRYQAGEATAQEVVDAQTTLAGARNGLSDGLIRFRIAVANLQTITGAF